MRAKPITFSIVDDETGLRESIVSYLTVKGGFQFVSQYARAEDALTNLPAEHPSVVLMDIKMKGMDGIECVRRLKEGMPNVLVIMLTVFEDDDLIFDALMAGATGYLLKRQPPEKLAEAIHEVMAGGSPMSATIARKVVQLLQNSGSPGKTSIGTRMLLSARQREMLDLLAAGQPYKIIADKMGVSIHTVRSYIRRTYEKLQVHTRTEAVAKYLDHRG
jgi:DNA-binding NarL/FixJ family response regulator